MTTSRPLNHEILVAPDCFGCGVANPEGLRIEIFRDGDRTDRLAGRFRPRPSAGGFPSIVHGGAQYTVLDCMAGWTVFVLRSAGQAMALTRTATMRYHRPARLTDELALSAQVSREAVTPRDPLGIHAEIRDPGGALVSEADFEYVQLPVDRFLRAVGLDALPDAYRRHFGAA